MVEHKDIHKAIDEKVRVIDSKMKDAFSQVKKDMHEMKKIHAKSGNAADLAKLQAFYETKLQQMKVQSTLDRAQLEAEYAKRISSLEDQHEALKHTIFAMGKQMQGMKSSKKLGKAVDEVHRKKKSAVAALQILIVLAVVGVLSYFLFSHAVTITGLVGAGESGYATAAGITGALVFMLIILGLMLYSRKKTRKYEEDY